MGLLRRRDARVALQSQTFRNQNAVKQVEAPLHNQREERRRNRPFQNRDVIVQIQPAQDWLAVAARSNQRRKRGSTNVNNRAGFNSR